MFSGVLQRLAREFVDRSIGIECETSMESMWTVHSYNGDYNPVHDHGTRTPMGVSCIYYLKVPRCIERLGNPAEEFGGLCNLRFDDTNPDTESVEFVNSIRHDIEWLLGKALSTEPLFASDYFDNMFEWAITLITKGKAYVDDQDATTISDLRGSYTKAGVDSPFRERSPEENLELFLKMRDGGFPEGSCVLRAKIAMDHENMNMRDPVLYRIRNESHFRTGEESVSYTHLTLPTKA